MNPEAFRAFLVELQTNIVSNLEALEAKRGSAQRFERDTWSRAEGGGGVSAVFSGGAVVEKAGVMFSDISINKLPASASKRHPALAGLSARAMGVSVVIHPKNPYAPTSHMNVRLFVATPKDADPIWWFGGGFDLTPIYGFDSDCVFWHQEAKRICAPFGDSVYPEFKQACDSYFYLPHRDEPRGVGGLFFDDLNQWGFETCFDFVQAVGNTFNSAYTQILDQRADTAYGQKERDFQLYRRGRYVEFNLIYDRGTLFGLQSGGRTESILVSLPNAVSWSYRFEPEPGSKEDKLTSYYLKPKNWADLG